MINQLRDFALANAPVQTSVTETSYSKDGKTISVPSEVRTLERWGLWSSFDSYSDGQNLYQASTGIDYRILRHWLIGASARFGVLNRGQGLALAQGGVYTAVYEKGWWGVAGTLLGANQYTLYSGGGYDWHLGNWLLGPVINWQWDDDTKNTGFGLGHVEQVRAGGRLALVCGRFSPELQVMWQGQYGEQDPLRDNAIWAGAGLWYALSDSWALFGGYSFEGNSNYQINQGTLSVRWQF